MSLAAPSLDNNLPLGRKVWRVQGHGRACQLIEYEVTELAHHYARIRRAEHPDEWIDSRDLHNGIIRDKRQAELAHGFQSHPLGDIARHLLDTRCPEPLRASQWDLKLPIGADLIRAPQTIAAALRLLARLGCAERLPRPKRCPRYRLLQSHP